MQRNHSSIPERSVRCRRIAWARATAPMWAAGLFCLLAAGTLSVAAPRPASAQSSSRVTGKSCGGCGKPVSLSARVGDRCPHCGGRWGVERTNYTYSASPASPRGSRRAIARSEEPPVLPAPPPRPSRLCLACRLPVPADSRVGMRCPRCSVVWTADGADFTTAGTGASLPEGPLLFPGPNRVRIANPNATFVRVCIVSTEGVRAVQVRPGGVGTASVPNGGYDVFFQFSDRPGALYLGDRFSVRNQDADIRLVQYPAARFIQGYLR